MSMIGKSLAHYEITAEIGKGGMGEVYQAKDQKLGRDVAIKVLPDEFARDADRIARFQREAKLLASLNHPNIAAIHGLEESDGTHFLVMELIEGQTLADRIKAGPIPVEESLKLALQIAEALESAHEKGVIHRDLKPANIKLTPDGKVKVLDFGLAKAYAGDHSDMNLSNSPTLSDMATQQGVILGTAAYMSPEQARGNPVDKRADIWAFGVVLFEMLTGRQIFSENTVSDTLASVLKTEPEWQSLPQNLHPRIRLLLERCLKKQPKNRYSGISDARVDIQEVLADPGGVYAQPGVFTKPKKRLRLSIPWVATVAILCGAAVWILKPVPSSEPLPVIRFDYDLPENMRFSQIGRHAIAVSADGLKIAYLANSRIYLKNADELTAMPIQGINGDPANPFFSPDGKSIGFFDLNSHQLKRIPISGGTPVPLCGVTEPVGATWGEDDKIVYGEFYEGIMRIPANGGMPDKIVSIQTGEYAACPQILPGGKSILFTIRKDDDFQVAVQSLESGERNVLFPGGPARYLPTGHLVYGSANSLFAVLFDLDSLGTTGSPVSVVEGVFREAFNRQTQLAISESGTLVYIPGSTSLGSQLELYDRQGNKMNTFGEQAHYGQFSLSPDEKRVVIEREGDLWLLDLDRGGIGKPITFTPSNERDPIWSPDGDSIAFSDSGGIYRKSLAVEEDPELLLEAKESHLLVTEDWSDDGKFISFLDASNTEVEGIGILPLSEGQTPERLFPGRFFYDEPKFSTDGKWLAYLSNEAGGLREVYIRSLTGDGRKERISTGGGGQPQWREDGKELFYLSPDGTLMAVAIEMRGDQLSLGDPQKLFQTGIMVDPTRDQYAVTGDGESFYMLTPSQTIEVASINFVLNWFEELKRTLPVK